MKPEAGEGPAARRDGGLTGNTTTWAFNGCPVLSSSEGHVQIKGCKLGKVHSTSCLNTCCSLHLKQPIHPDGSWTLAEGHTMSLGPPLFSPDPPDPLGNSKHLPPWCLWHCHSLAADSSRWVQPGHCQVSVCGLAFLVFDCTVLECEPR